MSNDDDKTIIRFVVILIIVLIACVGIYFATKYLVNKDSDTNTTDSSKNTNEVEINNSIAIVGTMLKKKEDNYYVLLYNGKSDEVSKYKSIISSYSNKTTPLYTVDLSSGLNSKYYSENETNPVSTNLEELKYGNVTLIKVNKGIITNAYESIETIKQELKLS